MQNKYELVKKIINNKINLFKNINVYNCFRKLLFITNLYNKTKYHNGKTINNQLIEIIKKLEDLDKQRTKELNKHKTYYSLHLSTNSRLKVKKLFKKIKDKINTRKLTGYEIRDYYVSHFSHYNISTFLRWLKKNIFCIDSQVLIIENNNFFIKPRL